MFQLQLSLQLKSHKKQDSADELMRQLESKLDDSSQLRKRSHKKQESTDELMRQLGSKLDDTYNPKKKRKLVQGLLQPGQSAQGREYLYSGGIRIKKSPYTRPRPKKQLPCTKSDNAGPGTSSATEIAGIINFIAIANKESS